MIKPIEFKNKNKINTDKTKIIKKILKANKIQK